MNNRCFIAVSILLFSVEYFLSIFWPFLLQTDIFAIWILTVFFLDRRRRLNWWVIFGTVIFFDLWSSGFLGGLTLALLFTMLIIFLAKKIIFTENRNSFAALFWLVLFYYFYVFLNLLFRPWTEQFIWPEFNLSGLAITIFWTMLMRFIRSVCESSAEQLKHSAINISSPSQ